MTVQQYEHSGIAGSVDLMADMGASDLAFDVSDGTGYPTGTTGHFFVAIHKGLSNEEKIECTSRSGNHFVVAADGRGADSTTPAIHLAGARIVQHVVTALEHSNDSAHISDVTRDDHTQYLTTARHDVTGRHTFGAAYGTPAAPAAIGTTPSAGTGDNPAREDHIHELGAGAIDNANMFAAGVVDAVAIATDAVGTAEIAANAVGASELADSAVDAPAIATGAISGLTKFLAGTRPYLVQSAQPSSPTIGDSYFDTDDGILYFYQGATTGWTKAWGQPWGVQAKVAVATDQGSITSVVDVTSATVTWSAVANRLYEISVIAACKTTATPSGVPITVTDGAGVLKYTSQIDTAINNSVFTNAFTYYETGLASGSVTRKLQAAAGSGTLTIAGTVAATQLLVKDIGPTGNPA